MSSNEARAQVSEASISFLQKEHKNTIESLQSEIDNLHDSRAGLTAKLVEAGIMIPEEIKLEEDVHLTRHHKKQMEKSLARKTHRIDKLKKKLRTERAAHEEIIRNMRDEMTSLQDELNRRKNVPLMCEVSADSRLEDNQDPKSLARSVSDSAFTQDTKPKNAKDKTTKTNTRQAEGDHPPRRLPPLSCPSLGKQPEGADCARAKDKLYQRQKRSGPLPNHSGKPNHSSTSNRGYPLAPVRTHPPPPLRILPPPVKPHVQPPMRKDFGVATSSDGLSKKKGPLREVRDSRQHLSGGADPVNDGKAAIDSCMKTTHISKKKDRTEKRISSDVVLRHDVRKSQECTDLRSPLTRKEIPGRGRKKAPESGDVRQESSASRRCLEGKTPASSDGLPGTSGASADVKRSFEKKKKNPMSGVSDDNSRKNSLFTQYPWR